MPPEQNEKNKERLIIDGEIFYTSQEILKMFPICERTLQRWRTDGIIRYMMVGRLIIYPASGLKEMVEKYTVRKGKKK